MPKKPGSGGGGATGAAAAAASAAANNQAKFRDVIRELAEKHNTTYEDATVSVSGGRKQVHVLSVGETDGVGAECFTDKMPSLRGRAKDDTRPIGVMFIPPGWKAAVWVRCVWVGEVSYASAAGQPKDGNGSDDEDGGGADDEPANPNALRPVFRVSRIDENSLVADLVSEWRTTPGKACADVYNKRFPDAASRGERPNGKLFLGIHTREIQEELRARARAGKLVVRPKDDAAKGGYEKWLAGPTLPPPAPAADPHGYGGTSRSGGAGGGAGGDDDDDYGSKKRPRRASAAALAAADAAAAFRLAEHQTAALRVAEQQHAVFRAEQQRMANYMAVAAAQAVQQAQQAHRAGLAAERRAAGVGGNPSFLSDTDFFAPSSHAAATAAHGASATSTSSVGASGSGSGSGSGAHAAGGVGMPPSPATSIGMLPSNFTGPDGRPIMARQFSTIGASMAAGLDRNASMMGSGLGGLGGPSLMGFGLGGDSLMLAPERTGSSGMRTGTNGFMRETSLDPIGGGGGHASAASAAKALASTTTSTNAAVFMSTMYTPGGPGASSLGSAFASLVGPGSFARAGSFGLGPAGASTASSGPGAGAPAGQKSEAAMRLAAEGFISQDVDHRSRSINMLRDAAMAVASSSGSSSGSGPSGSAVGGAPGGVPSGGADFPPASAIVGGGAPPNAMMFHPTYARESSLEAFAQIAAAASTTTVRHQG